ncbi:MAG: class I SAM-dependent methyltransferase [Actinomycetota bacterium]|nr:class I SAM-dependent methyltransferase [Actinomycetota bacterium]
MIPVVKEGIEEYAAAHTSPPPPWLAALGEETQRDNPMAGMMVGPLEGRFLEFLVFASGARRVLEIGTFTGYSALSMAAGLPDGGRIVTCDIDPGVLAVARRHIASSPYADRIEIREGLALDTVAGLDGPFDLVFIDADKTNYAHYYEAVLPKLAERGLIVVDNTLWSGAVLDASDTAADTEAIRTFNDMVRNDPRVVCVQLTVRDGVTLIRRA